MRTTIRIAIAALLLAAGRLPAQELPSPTARPAFAALPAEVRDLVVTWLDRDCGAQERSALEDRLRTVGPKLEPVFWEAYRLGPLPAERKREETYLRESYRVRQSWLAEEGAGLLGPEETARQQRVPEDEYVRRGLEQNAIGYRTGAILGLALVGTSDSVPELEKIADRPDDPAAEAAHRALAAIAAPK